MKPSTMVRRIHSYAGLGHFCGLYTYNADYVYRATAELKVSRILVRQAHRSWIRH